MPLAIESLSKSAGPAMRRAIAFGAIFLLAVLVRAGAVLFVPNVPYTDAIYFDFECVRSFAAGEYLSGFRHWVPPLYPLLVSVPYRLTADMETAVHTIGIICGALTVFPTAALAATFFGRHAAWIAALFLALHPYHVRISIYGSSHASYVLFFALALLAALRLIARPSWRRAILFGLAAGAAYWIRQEVTALVIFAVLALIVPIAFRVLRRRAAPRLEVDAVGARIAAACVALAVFVLLVFPIIYGTHEATGRWVLSSKGGVSLFGRGRELNRLAEDRTHILWETQIETMEDFRPLSLLGPLLSEPATTFLAWGRQFASLLAHFPEAFAFLLFPLALLALIWRRCAGRDTVADRFTAAFVLMNVALLACFYDSKRLLASLIPIFAAWSAVGLLELCAWVGRKSAGESGGEIDRDSARGRMARAGALLLATLLVPFLAHIPARWGYYVGPSREAIAGAWLRAEFGAGRSVMDLDGRIAYYAAGKPIVMPLAPPADLLFYAQARGVEFITGSERKLQETRAVFCAALAAGELPGIEEIRRFDWSKDDGDRRGLGADSIKIYRLR